MSSEKKIEEPFTGLRGFFWPIYNYELKKFLPMGLMMLCILFNYTILRDIKDVLVAGLPGGGAESFNFLKIYAVLPFAILFMVFFVKLSNKLKPEKLFYTVLFPFLIFFAVFAFFLYPNREFFEASLETVQAYQTSWPRLHWVIPVIGGWTSSLFYVMAELWGSVILSMLFWQFANQITKVNESKRHYGLYGLIGNIGLLLSGELLKRCSKYAKTLPDKALAFGFNLKILMSVVVILGIVTALAYRWMNANVLTDPTLYQAGEGAKKKSKPKLSITDSFKLIMQTPYLGLIAVLVLAYGISINMVEATWKSQIKAAFPDANDRAHFMGQFSQWTGAITMLLMIVGNNILRRLNWLTAAIITPLMILGTSIVFFWVIWEGNTQDPHAILFGGITVMMLSVWVGQIQNVLSKATKYSLFDSTKSMAYIPLDPELKTKGQAAVEVIGGRAGKSGGALFQTTLLTAIGGSVTLPSLVHILGPSVIIICVIWMFATVALGKRFEALKKENASA